jgi:AraC-like DNA-binding protein
MKPILLKVPCGPSQSFSIRKDSSKYFYNYWHYHFELELTYIRKGSGIHFVGDNITNFESGDLVLLGSNLPHFWKSDAKYFEDDNEDFSESTAIHFTPDFWGEAFLNLPELIPVQSLLAKAGRGLRIFGETKVEVCRLMDEIYERQGLDRIFILAQALELISTSAETAFISSPGFDSTLNAADTKRLSAIYNYTLTNFTRKIKLQEVAAIAHMTPNAFCRYFKARTRKTYNAFLLEIRIGHACKLLIEDRLSIGQISFESGFQDCSNFNRYFKAVKKQTSSNKACLSRAWPDNLISTACRPGLSLGERKKLAR